MNGGRYGYGSVYPSTKRSALPKVLLERTTEEADRAKLLSLLVQEEQKQKGAGDDRKVSSSVSILGSVGRIMKLLAGYLERARQLEFLAGETKDDPRFKRMLLRQVVAYRMLAVKRADKLHLPIPPLTALRTARRKNRIELRGLAKLAAARDATEAFALSGLTERLHD
jgi:hypothetical protein